MLSLLPRLSLLFPPPWCLIAHPSSAFRISSSHQCGRVCKGGVGLISIQDGDSLGLSVS